MESIPVKKLKRGDIFMCYYEHPDFSTYLDALITVIRLRHHKEEEEFLKATFTILRGLIIWFDGDEYSHASFWDGEKVAEAGGKGIERNDISYYKNTETHVYRFVVDDKLVLGTPQYPVKPLIDTLNEIVSKHLPYSYDTAMLYMFLCFTRWKREEWINLIKEFLLSHTSKFTHPIVERFFQKHDHDLRAFLEWLADDIIDKILEFRKDKGMVCSEFVAAVFNTTEPKGHYELSKPLRSSASFTSAKNLLSVSEDDANTLDTLGELLQSTTSPLSKNTQEVDIERIGILYTPHDIAGSVNTKKVGVLDLGTR